MVNSCEKGKRGERELARAVSKVFGIACRRGQQYSGSPDSPDVCSEDGGNAIPGAHVECKRAERFNLYTALNQSAQDAGKEEIPVVCHRRNLQDWVVVVYLDDLPALAKAICKALKAKEPQK